MLFFLILVWVNGEYKFGVGNPPGFRANDVSLGNLNPGKNYIQIIRSDYGLATNYRVNITGDLIEKEEIEEPGLSGISIYLDSNDNNVLDNGEPVQVTAADDPTTPNIDETGQYEFNNLEPGTYIVREVIRVRLFWRDETTLLPMPRTRYESKIIFNGYCVN